MNWFEEIIATLPVGEIPSLTMKSLGFYAALVVGFVVLERVLGKDVQRYRQKTVAYDFIYCIFYNGGYLTLIVFPFLKITEWSLAPHGIDLLPGMSMIPAVIIFYLATDFVFYWSHRALHSKLLWPFHSIHHSQRELTFLTTARFHVFDVMFLTLTTAVPAVLLGFPSQAVYLTVLLMAQDKVQHANLDWTYGPLYGLFVSPRFHRIHHSAEPDAHGHNFGRLFSVWDYVFGTAHHSKEEPAEFGVRDLELPESFRAHFTYPFRTLWSMYGRPRKPTESRVY
ncbi:MAG: sterol desaturase family protein [Acidobacteria bacterium]|nr:sterol desaturase family protein [Acidobacteriota bacterium]